MAVFVEDKGEAKIIVSALEREKERLEKEYRKLRRGKNRYAAMEKSNEIYIVDKIINRFAHMIREQFKL